MAKTPRLKVYVTPIGFHDAYVAAPSQKAALRAWGTATDLFGAGRATLVASGEGYDAAIATPGAVIKRLRGSEAAMLDFAPPEPTEAPSARYRAGPKAAAKMVHSSKILGSSKTPGASKIPGSPKPPRAAEKPVPKPEPPDRSRVEAAEAALDRAERDLAEELARVEAERRALDARETALKDAASVPLRDLRAERDAARRAYGTALAAFERRH